MVMVEQLQWLSACGKPWAEQRAKMAMDINEALRRNDISAEEYQELMGDLINSDKLNEEADDLEIKNYLVATIMIGAKLA